MFFFVHYLMHLPPKCQWSHDADSSNLLNYLLLSTSTVKCAVHLCLSCVQFYLSVIMKVFCFHNTITYIGGGPHVWFYCLHTPTLHNRPGRYIHCYAGNTHPATAQEHHHLKFTYKADQLANFFGVI